MIVMYIFKIADHDGCNLYGCLGGRSSHLYRKLVIVTSSQHQNSQLAALAVVEIIVLIFLKIIVQKRTPPPLPPLQCTVHEAVTESRQV